MAVTKNDYSTSHAINPYYINIEQSASQADIIIVTDVINNSEPGNINMQLTGDLIWLKIYIDHSFVVMSEEPKDLEAFEPSIEKLNKMRLRLKTGEVFAIQYNNSAKNDATQRTAVTGFQMETGDLVFVKIDTQNDLLTLYHE